MLKPEDTTSTPKMGFQEAQIVGKSVLPAKMSIEAPKAPAVVTRSLFAGPESAANRTIVLPSMGLGKMIRNFLATLKSLTRLICDEPAMIERTECIILVLHLPDMLQPFVLPKKCAILRRARVIWAFPFSYG
jgi:hypothetical protein